MAERGKKFTAAEKHFLEKEMKLRKFIKQLEESKTNAESKSIELERQNKALQSEVERLTAENEKFKEISGLSEKDLKLLIDSAKNAKMIRGLLSYPTTSTYNPDFPKSLVKALMYGDTSEIDSNESSDNS